MTIVKDLIATLQTRNPNAQVFLMTQRKQPFENHLAGVVGREEMADQAWRIEPGITRDDVFLVTGKRIRPGTLSAWIIAEHHQQVGPRAADANTNEFNARLAEVVTEIAKQHLRIDSLEEVGWDSADFHEVSKAGLRDALQAAYLAGRADRDVELNREDGPAAQAQAADAPADSSTLPPSAEPDELDSTSAGSEQLGNT